MAQGDTAALLKSIRGHTQLPTAQITFDNATTLEIATEELYSYLLPTLLQERQEFWTGAQGRYTIALQEGVGVYPIRPRAAGMKIRSARLLDIVGTPTPLATYELEDVNKWVQDSGYPSGLVLEGGSFRLFPTPRGLAGWSVEVQTYLRPAALVESIRCAVVNNILPVPAGQTSVQVLINADNMDLISGVGTLDIVRSTPPFEGVAVNAALTDAINMGGSSYQLIFAGTFDVAEGDYVCLPDTAPVVQAPLEWHPLLALKVAARQLASVGDTEMASVKAAELKEKEAKVGIVIRPRREDAGRKVGNGTSKWRSGWPSTW